MKTLQERLLDLNEIGVPFSIIAKKAKLDRSTVSKFARSKTNVSIMTEEQIREAIATIKGVVERV